MGRRVQRDVVRHKTSRCQTLDDGMHHAFQRASELAPSRFEFAYRYAESFYDLEKPDWDVPWLPCLIERDLIPLDQIDVEVEAILEIFE